MHSTTSTLLIKGQDIMLPEVDTPPVLHLQSLPIPQLAIAEQPVQFYRYRYESEIEKDSSRVGGLLHGRNSSEGNKTFTRLSVSGIDPEQHSQLQLTVCTVRAEDKAPHPYYLHGDNCKDGYFQLSKSIDSSFKGGRFDISLNRLAIICVPRKSQKDIENGVEMRRKLVPPLPDYIEKPNLVYESRNLGQVRLAFSLSISDTRGAAWFLPTLFSDEILDEKEKKSIDVDCLNPAEVPLTGATVAVLTKTPTTGITKSDVSIELSTKVSNSLEKAKRIHICELLDMKKYLLVIRIPDMRHYTSNDRLKGQLTVRSNRFSSEELDIVFSTGSGSPKSRKRPAN